MVKSFLNGLKSLVFERVIMSPRVQHLEFKGQQMVIDVFEIMAHDPKRFLPQANYHKYLVAENDSRIICDYIAGMTDDHLMRLYERLFSPRMGSVFDQL